MHSTQLGAEHSKGSINGWGYSSVTIQYGMPVSSLYTTNNNQMCLTELLLGRTREMAQTVEHLTNMPDTLLHP